MKTLFPRFVWIVGAIREEMPDLPSDVDYDGSLVLWDRQERCAVMTVAPNYAQLLCLEKGNAAPFSALETWINGLSNRALASEGITETRAAFPPVAASEGKGEFMSPALDDELSQRAKDATIDISPITNAPTHGELCRIGGGLMLTAVGNANLAAVQLAMRQRAAQLRGGEAQ